MTFNYKYWDFQYFSQEHTNYHNISVFIENILMNVKNIIDIIAEEVKQFDFLGNDERNKEQEINELLMNEELQKQFICDALLGKTDKVKIEKIEDSYLTGNWDEFNQEDADRLSLEYSLIIDYHYDRTKPPIRFNLYFNADRINISVGGWYDPGRWGGTMADAIEPSGESWYDGFDWSDIDVNIYNTEGDEIEFKAFKNAPPKIQELFIKHFVQGFIENQSLEFRTDDQKDKIQDVPYC